MKKSRKGQTLIVMIGLMLVAMVIGAVVSSRFLARLKNFSTEDDASKAAAVSEAGIERMLNTPISTLEGYINNNNCASNCVIQIADSTGRNITANVTLSYAGNSASLYEMSLKTGEIAQLVLNGYTSGKLLKVCWNTSASIYANYLYLDSSNLVKSAQYAYNASSNNDSTDGFTTATGSGGYSSCFTVTATGTPQLLRIRSMFYDTPAYVLPDAGQLLPKQGIIITSKGTIGSAIKTTKVLRSYPLAPLLFDYVLYQQSQNDPLSNRSY